MKPSTRAAQRHFVPDHQGQVGAVCGLHAIHQERWPVHPDQQELQVGRRGVHAAEPDGRGEKIPVAGKVTWITPKGAQGNRAAGVGVQFNDGDNTARSRIETHLAGALKSDRPTHTM